MVLENMTHPFLKTLIGTFLGHLVYFLFLLNNVFVTASKLSTKRNKTGFILYAPDTSPLKFFFDFLFYVKFDSVIKTVNKKYYKIIYSVGFTKPT